MSQKMNDPSEGFEAKAFAIQELLQTLCTSVSVLSSNEAQTVFSLQTTKEAQLVYEVLAAHGFDVRVYHEEQQSKLYFNQQTVTPQDATLAAVLSHARTLRNILDMMNNTSENAKHRISFINSASGMGKQISIFIPSAETAAATQQQQSARPLPALKQRPSQPPATAWTGGKRRRKKQDFLAAGPAVAKKMRFIEKGGISGWLHNYFVSNFAESFYAFVLMVFLALITISLLVTSKGFFCPDLATVKSRAWYCK